MRSSDCFLNDPKPSVKEYDLKTRIDPKTKAKSVTFEAFELRRLNDARDILDLAQSENVKGAADAKAALVAFLVAVSGAAK